MQRISYLSYAYSGLYKNEVRYLDSYVHSFDEGILCGSGRHPFSMRLNFRKDYGCV